MIKWFSTIKAKLNLGLNAAEVALDVAEDVVDGAQEMLGGDPDNTLQYNLIVPRCQPTVPQAGDAGVDLRAAENTVIPSNSSAVISLGIGFQIPEGFFGVLTHRSSLAFNKDCILSLGIIDCNFTGEVKAKVFNLGSEEVSISQGDRIAQIIIVRYADFLQLQQVGGLVDGKEGFGSSGVN